MITAKELRKIAFNAREKHIKEIDTLITDSCIREAQFGCDYVYVALPVEVAFVRDELEDKLNGHGLNYQWDGIEGITVSW